MKKYFFFLGLILFYFITFFAPHKLIYFSAYFASTFFFYKATNSIRRSLLYSLILSLFSDFGFAKSIFMMEPKEFNLGPGYFISPMTIFGLSLLPFSLVKNRKTYQSADLFVLVFFILSLVSFYIFPYTNVLYGVISLGEIILVYFILRNQLVKDDYNIPKILISLIIFQIILAGTQFLLQRPLGQVAEGVITNNPYGLTTREDTNLFRLSGTFAHPNFLASFILQTFPFTLLYPSTYILLNLLKILSLVVLVFTYSRAAWIIFALIIILLFFAKQIHLKFLKVIPLYYYLIPISLTFLFIILTPYLNARLNSFPQAFEEYGSFGVRTKLLEEGISLVSQYPLTGVGLYRSIEEYANNPVTDLFERVPVGRFYGIHNTPLEIASEIGIPGLLFFVFFILFVFQHYLKSKRTYLKNAAFFGLLGLLGISMFNPFFHTSQFRIFFLLAAIILA